MTDFIAANTQRVANLLASQVHGYNRNPLQGSVAYHLLADMRSRLDALWDTYYDAYQSAADEVATLGDDAAADVTDEEHEAVGYAHDLATDQLDPLSSWFREYDTFWQGNQQAVLAGVRSNSLFAPVFAVHLDAGTVAQSMQAEDRVALVNLRAMRGKRVPHPGGDPGGPDRSGTG